MLDNASHCIQIRTCVVKHLAVCGRFLLLFLGHQDGGLLVFQTHVDELLGDYIQLRDPSDPRVRRLACEKLRHVFHLLPELLVALPTHGSANRGHAILETISEPVLGSEILHKALDNGGDGLHQSPFIISVVGLLSSLLERGLRFFCREHRQEIFYIFPRRLHRDLSWFLGATWLSRHRCFQPSSHPSPVHDSIHDLHLRLRTHVAHPSSSRTHQMHRPEPLVWCHTLHFFHHLLHLWRRPHRLFASNLLNNHCLYKHPARTEKHREVQGQ
mmetsp:Transcript_134444/g.287630  ORF Transcript_134444/g.287630 Transcript_134444/m.287630 type:complete len:271 (-) Transcript_134444:91-903(-)